MRILLVHNDYAKLSGEEVVVDGLARLLASRGHQVTQFRRSSAEITGSAAGAARAFLAGVYNPCARRRFRGRLEAESPDIVHVHNLYPLLSISVLDEAASQGVPVVMTLHNYRLLCPSGTFLSHGEICTRCLGPGGELNCVVRNCEGSLPKSMGYAVRSAVGRGRRTFLDKVAHFIVPTRFQKTLHVDQGFSAERISVIPHMTDDDGSGDADEGQSGGYVGYVGRISPEKGVDLIVEAARKLPKVRFAFAGDYGRMPDLVRTAPGNCSFLGPLERGDALSRFYRGARFLVVSSIWYEVFALANIEAMARSRAVVCSRIGGLPEIIEDGVNGLLFAPGDGEDLAQKVQRLWERPKLAARMGRAGREHFESLYTPEAHYRSLLKVYERARQASTGP